MNNYLQIIAVGNDRFSCNGYEILIYLQSTIRSLTTLKRYMKHIHYLSARAISVAIFP